MGIFSVFIINKAGGLIFQYDHYSQRPEVEKTFSFPIELVLKQQDEKLVVAFGERDGIKGVYFYHVYLFLCHVCWQCIWKPLFGKGCKCSINNDIINIYQPASTSSWTELKRQNWNVVTVVLFIQIYTKTVKDSRC